MEISITAGRPDEADIAALVLALRTRGPAEAAPVPRVSAWGDPARRLGMHRDWRSTTLPR
ncbi:MAG: acyl-CoA carboxylase subunit epsilon [Stackebrandtia sp.]